LFMEKVRDYWRLVEIKKLVEISSGSGTPGQEFFANLPVL